MNPMSTELVRLGVVGLGRAATALLPSVLAHEGMKLVAVTDLDSDRAERCAADLGCTAHPDLDTLVTDPDIEAVYVATPHEHHVADAVAAAEAGRHVLVEKPMALSLPECRRMVEAADHAGVHLTVGPTHGSDPITQLLREIVASGTYGRLRMVWTTAYTDFLYRPRRPAELRTELGGGVLFNQLPHQVDVVRTLHGTGEVRSVRAHVGSWDPSRPTEGAYTALVEFADGAIATLTYSGYAHFDTDAWFGWIGESGSPKDPDARLATRAALADVRPGDEARAKHATGYSGPHSLARRNPVNTSRSHLGLLVASLDGADLVTTPHGIDIHHDGGTEHRTAAGGPGALDELYAAVRTGAPPLHNGRWGTDTLAVCLAVLVSARERREVRLADLPTDAGPTTGAARSST